MSNRWTFILLLCLASIGIQAQADVITLSNPSFEDTPRRGGADLVGIKGWYDCGIINFPRETAPDIHPQDFWANTKQAADGKTYIGMVVRDNDTWESVSQRMSTPMEAGQCYSFSAMVSRSERYISGSRLQLQVNNNKSENFNYTTPTVMRVWGGSGYCNTKELLAETVPIRHTEWETYNFKLSPSFNHKFITIEAFYKVPILVPYNGHILVDNLSDIVKIDCSEEIVATAEKKKIPAHKRRVKKPKKDSPKADAEEKVTEVVSAPAPKKKTMNLDRSKIKTGQTIEIKNLYFLADVAEINENSNEVLDEVFEFLNANRDITIEIGGHTNSTPSHEYCDRLSTARAKEVAVYLVDKGIDGDRIYYKGYGKRKAIATNATKEGRKKNQRVEIKILSIG